VKTFEVQFIKEYPNGMRMVGDKTKCVGPTKEDAVYNYVQQFSHLFDKDFNNKVHFMANVDLNKGWIVKELS
jgi:cephalosporin hydroxylase